MPFTPGHSYGGRRKEKLYYEALMLDLKRTDKDNISKLQRIAEKHVQLAMEGDIQAINGIANRLDGAPAVEQYIDITQYQTVIRAPAVKADTEAWQQKQLTASNTTSSGNPSQGHKLNS